MSRCPRRCLLETELNKMSDGQAAQQLEGVMAAGFLRLEGDQYKSTARFEGGKLLVNGKEIPLPAAAPKTAGAEEVAAGTGWRHSKNLRHSECDHRQGAPVMTEFEAGLNRLPEPLRHPVSSILGKL
jgi:hypothetical protein